MNPDCGKAYHVRGAAHCKLGHWKKAHRDLSQGQKLDFQDQSVAMHSMVTKKAGADVPKARSLPAGEKATAKSKNIDVVEIEDPKPGPSPPTKNFKVGQAVRLFGLQKAPQLNGRRGLVQRLSDTYDRWEVEIRMDRGRVEVKAIRSENIYAVSQAQASNWQLEEALFAEERKKRDKEDKKWKEEEERTKRLDAQRAKAEGRWIRPRSLKLR